MDGLNDMWINRNEEHKKKDKKIKCIAIDFDGVIADYSKGWRGVNVFGDVMPGVKKAICKFQDMGYKVILWTTRKPTIGLSDYLYDNDLEIGAINCNPYIKVNNPLSDKIIADLYIDDRALRFNGDWRETFNQAIKILKSDG